MSSELQLSALYSVILPVLGLKALPCNAVCSLLLVACNHGDCCSRVVACVHIGWCLACCVFAAGVAGWYHKVIMFVGYEVGAIWPAALGCSGSRDYAIGWHDHSMVIWD